MFDNVVYQALRQKHKIAVEFIDIWRESCTIETYNYKYAHLHTHLHIEPLNYTSITRRDRCCMSYTCLTRVLEHPVSPACNAIHSDKPCSSI